MKLLFDLIILFYTHRLAVIITLAAMYLLYTLTRTRKGDMIPLLGQLWYLNRLERAKYQAQVEMERSVGEIVRGQIRACRQTGIAEIVPAARSGSGASVERTVELGPYFVGEGTIYSFIQTPLPKSHSIEEMRSPEFELNAHQNTHYETKLYHSNPEDGFVKDTRSGFYFLRTSMEFGLSGIPKLVQFEDAYAALVTAKKEGRLGNLAWVVGAGENNKFVFGDFRKIPHLLGAGSTGGGKTMDAIQMILTWGMENSPGNLKLLLVDMKRNTFNLYFNDLPHLLYPVATTMEAGMQSVAWLRAERERRSASFENFGRRTIHEWNKRVPNGQSALPAIVLVVDEIHMLMLRNPSKAEFEEDIWDVTSLGRELGLFVALYTQYPVADVVSTAVKTNIENRVCHFTDGNGSNVVLGVQDAKALPSHPGRLIFKNAATLYALQAPIIASDYAGWSQLHDDTMQERISAGIRSSVLKIQKKWEQDDPRERILVEYIRARQDWRVDGEEEIYNLIAHEIRKDLKGKGGFGGIFTVEEFLRRVENRVIEVSGVQVSISPAAGRTPRRAKFVHLSHAACLMATTPTVPPPTVEEEVEEELEENNNE
jgi:hypothetical protein